MSNKSAKGLAIVSGIIGGVFGITKALLNFSSQSGLNDMGCDWYCDNCGASLNSQHGFYAGDTWVCTKCGYENDVSENNICGTRLVDDDRGGFVEVTDFPNDELEDPEDY